MEGILGIKRREKNITQLLRKRELNDSANPLMAQSVQVTEPLISRLGLERELNGHKGCVNCLEWNKTGDTLASASDDMKVILWNPFTYKTKLVLNTGHTGNIFTVKFMPESNDGILMTGAGDCKVRVHDIAHSETLFVCNCHSGRVKRIAAATSVPFLFWSAGEDGLILQYDVRVPHTCRSSERKSVLVNLVNHMGHYAEAKCIAINERRPELLAVGANDAYVRLYDRRMIRLVQTPIGPAAHEWYNNSIRNAGKGDPNSSVPTECTQYFVAGHLHWRPPKDASKSVTVTYVSFSEDGNELLVNMGGEQIYLFDINRQNDPRNYIDYNKVFSRDTSNGDCENEGCENPLNVSNAKVLPEEVDCLKRRADEIYEKKDYNAAVALYSQAIDMCSNSAVLFANRGAALIKRAWGGDIYAALRDCQIALLLDPEHIKSHFRLAKCLFDIGRPSDAQKVLTRFQRIFKEFKTNSACKALRKDIEEALNADNSANQSNVKISSYEQLWRDDAIDYKIRFCGHCNTTTDIKEASFFGKEGQYIVAGSDDGAFFIWDRNTTNILRAFKGDDRIVNCLQPHSSLCLLATSGIDPVIRLWSPLPEDGKENERVVKNLEDAAKANQVRMNSDPFELMLMNMGYRIPPTSSQSSEDGPDESGTQMIGQPLNCRPS